MTEQDLDEAQRPAHLTYKQYQRKVTKNPNEGLMIFVSAFFIMLLLFLAIAKQVSPDIDVTIGDDSQNIAEQSVDDRLKAIQEEDAGKRLENEMFSPELDEKVKLPDSDKNKSAREDVTKTMEPPIPAKTKAEIAKPETPAPVAEAPKITSKVVVGYYSTEEQAQVARGILAESGLTASPFVKNIGGAYTIQVGSYSTREKAQSAVNDLLRNNFPARIITE